MGPGLARGKGLHHEAAGARRGPAHGRGAGLRARVVPDRAGFRGFARGARQRGARGHAQLHEEQRPQAGRAQRRGARGDRGARLALGGPVRGTGQGGHGRHLRAGPGHPPHGAHGHPRGRGQLPLERAGAGEQWRRSDLVHGLPRGLPVCAHDAGRLGLARAVRPPGYRQGRPAVTGGRAEGPRQHHQRRRHGGAACGVARQERGLQLRRLPLAPAFAAARNFGTGLAQPDEHAQHPDRQLACGHAEGEGLGKGEPRR
mmetsp:Transcript_17826/g.45943  ORF Transcript_17826/g.45943 Transcript_17826/m.45943 type:complete len:258 (+) Transcript_17826:735-1508(+)